jgi:transposase
MGERELGAALFPQPKGGRQSDFVSPDFPTLQRELISKGMTLLLLWQEYRELHPDDGYSYSQFCHRYNHWLGAQKRSMRQVHVAGEKCFVDYAGATVPIVNAATGECVNAQIFVAVLGASGYTFAHASLSQTEADWIHSHNAAFAFFGGITEIVVPDCLKSAVTKSHPWVAKINPAYQSWADYTGTVIIPARVRRPKDKAKAELSVLLVTRWILMRLRHHTFFSLGQLNDAIAQLLDSLNERPFQRLPGSRKSVFEDIEREALKALPVTPYEYVHILNARVSIDYHIEYKRHYYSVPHNLTKTEVEVRASNKLVSIYVRGQRVACHPRSQVRAGYTTLTEHMPSGHRFMAEWSVERFESWAGDIGHSTLQVTRVQLRKKRLPEQSFRSVLALLALAKQYDRVRLEAACQRALEIGSPTRTSVASILKKGLDRLPLATAKDAELQDDLFLQDHENVRGSDAFD